MVCENGSSYCGSVYVTVNSTASGVTFSQSSVNLNLSQSTTVIVSGGTGAYILSGNTNPNVASVTLNGSSLYITALNNGSTNLTVCQSGNSTACGTIYLTVGSGTTTNSLVTFSNNNPVFASGQSQNITIYSSNGFNGSYVLSGNSNPSVTSVTVNGTMLTIIGSSAGSSTITVCQSGSSICGTLPVTITGTGTTSNSLTFTTTTISAATLGQSYSYQLQTTGGNGNYTYSITSGSLPPGLSLSTNGYIQGTPTIAGTYTFTLQVTDTSGLTGTANVNFTVNNTAPTPTPTVASSGYYSGELINENGTISIVYKNTKTGFANASAFTGLGFSFSNVVTVANSGLSTSGQIVTTASAAHPWGSWVLSGSTVYFVHQSGLIPVPNWNTFLNNGGQGNFIVPANSYDLALPHLAIMTAGDARMH